MSVKRYVNVDELFKTHPFTRCGGPLTDYAEGYLDCIEDAKESINNLATTDVVEVVRCKNCKLSSEPKAVSRLDLYSNNYDLCFCQKEQKLVCGTHFCSYGAKMNPQ